MRPRPRPSPSPRNQFAGLRNHRKMASVVFLLGLMMILFQYVGKPESWRWFTQLTNPQDLGSLDNRVQDNSLRPLEPGDVVVLPTNPEPSVSAEQPAASSTERKRFPGVTDKLLAPIRDDSPFSSSEHESFFELLNLVNNTPPAELATYAQADIPFSQLYAQPGAYRGQVLQLKGLLRAAFADLRAAPNDFGIEKYHEVWVSPLDRAKHEVFAIYCLDLPPEVPRGRVAKGTEPGIVEVTGFYFKRWAYPAQDNIRSTPLILAKTISWKLPPPTAKPGQLTETEDYTASLAMAVGIAVAVAAGVLWYATRKPAPDPTLARLTAFSSSRRLGGREALADLRELEVSPDVADALRRATTDKSTGSASSSSSGSE